MKGKGDFTRDTFDPRRHYGAVRLQQGRVGVDADFNEQADIVRHRAETGSADALGLSAAPHAAPGFRVVPTLDGSDLLLFPGRFYAGGVLAELDPEPEVPIAAFPAADRARVDTEALLGVALEVGDWVEVLDDNTATGAETGTVVQVLELDRDDGEARLSADVSAHDGPANPRLRRLVTYSAQPDLPEPPPLPAADGWYILYLDVWRYHVTHLEDPGIRELALGGPDTATRERTVAQVRWLEAGGLGDDVHCLSEPGAWLARTAPSLGTLRARSRPEETPDDPCIVPAGGGYTRLENQLYRVEVHRGGSPGDDPPPVCKWSRENGSIVTRWIGQDGDRVTVEESGRDAARAFAAGHWVELTDSGRELRGAPGTLVQLAGVEGDVLTVDPATATGTTDRDDFAPDPKVRRWDMSADAGATAIDPAGWIALEGGIEIRFGAGTYRSGDYWLFPARTFAGSFAGDVLWPRDEASGEAVPRPPDGIKHRYARLGLLRREGGALTVTDCRKTFPAATELVRFFRAGGDGQEARPGLELPCDLSVAVTDGQWPVEGARVRFETGSGSLQAPGDGPATSVVSTTGATGLATCRWILPEEAGAPPCLAVVATLLDSAGEPFPTPPLVFNAGLSLASEVAYDGAGCSHLADAETVQEALDRLCRNRALYYVSGDGQEGLPGEPLPRPLEARVTNGAWLEPGASVRFRIADDGGGGGLETEDGTDGREVVVETDDGGVARVAWRLDDEPRSQRVEASLLTADGETAGGPVAYNASLASRDDEPGIRIERVLRQDRSGAVVPLENDEEVTAAEIRPIRIDCDAPLDARSIRGKPSCFVTVEVPLRGQGGDGPLVGFHPLVVSAELAVSRNAILWRPTEGAVSYLSGEVFRDVDDARPRVLARLTIKGNVVWGTGDDRERLRYLDGEAFGLPASDRVELALPSGDGRRGGDFELWFWLRPVQDVGSPPFVLDVSSGRGLVVGLLRTVEGSVLPGLRVVLRRIDGTQGDRSALTDATGRFGFIDVPAGDYEVSVEVEGQQVSRRIMVGRDIVLDSNILGVQPVDLIDGIGRVFRDRLAERGVTQAALVADMEPPELARLLEISETQANTLIGNARNLLRGGQ
ncbi:MAG TPA: DUF6519 domain-containing protein [Thermoanaerobaculia bacterium]|nr:DUF6519 domain-containing protein [Thermoanaerobaculia bacterium]